MFLLDDLLLSPVRGLMAIGRHIQETARQTVEDQEKTILAELAELYRLLESGQIGDDEFNARETDLLDRLEETHEALDAADADEDGDG